MSRFVFFLLLTGLFFTVSCERCKRCSCTYTETVINQTPNGEEEEIIEKTTYVWDDEDSAYFTEECVKSKEEFTIDKAYEDFQSQSNLDNINCVCEEL